MYGEPIKKSIHSAGSQTTAPVVKRPLDRTDTAIGFNETLLMDF